MSEAQEQPIDNVRHLKPTSGLSKGESNSIIDVNDLSKVRRASHTGELKIFDITIPCAVLEDHTRLLTQRGVFVSLGRHKNPAKGQASIDDRPAFLAAKNLEPFIPDELREKWAPVPFQSRGGYGGNVAFGYRAEILPMVCNVFIDADNEQAKAHGRKVPPLSTWPCRGRDRGAGGCRHRLRTHQRSGSASANLGALHLPRVASVAKDLPRRILRADVPAARLAVPPDLRQTPAPGRQVDQRRGVPASGSRSAGHVESAHASEGQRKA